MVLLNDNSDSGIEDIRSKKPDILEFYVNGEKVVEKNADPETTLLTYIRRELRFTGSKLGCGEGGCGACTVMISKWDPLYNKIIHFSANACLAPVVSVHGCAVTTVEGIGSTKTKLHAVQERLAKFHGSQCGFCTPGIVMSMYALLRNKAVPNAEDIEACLQGNLCRCTGYRPILSAFSTFSDVNSGCPMKEKCCKLNGVSGSNDPHSVSKACFTRYDPSQEIIFPPELLIKSKSQQYATPLMFVGERVTWFRPTSLDQLIALKGKYPEAQLVNGNSEIGVECNVKGRIFPVIISPVNVSELSSVSFDKNGVTFGASCTLTNLREKFQIIMKGTEAYRTQWMTEFLDMLHWFAGDQIRNVAAIGGNIMTASPISDLNPILMANESLASFRSHSRGDRQVLIDQNFFPKYRTTCAAKDEVLLSVRVPFNEKDEYMKAYKQSKRKEDDIAIVNAAIRVVFHPGTNKVKKFVAAFGGMAATSVMPKKTMKNMIGRDWTDKLVEDYMVWIAEDLPLKLDAPGGMVEYREALTASFFFKFFLYVKNCLIENGIIEGSIKDYDTSVLSKLSVNGKLGTQSWQGTDGDQPVEDLVGKPIKHVSGDKHATGEAVYIDDMPMYKDELYLCFVTSTHAHAYVRNVDLSKAMSSPGFVTYVDHSDVKGSNSVMVMVDDDVIFAVDKVTCVGQTIGAVIADTQSHARRAAQLVQIEYEDISPVIVTIEDAIKHESFLCDPKKIIRGDPDKAMEDCDHVIEGEVRSAGQEHFYMETQACLAVPKLEDGEMEVFASSQDPTKLQDLVARCLGVKRNKVVVRTKRMGGGFGGKESRFWLVSNPVAIAAQKCGRPVRCMLSRKDDMIMTGGRHPFYAKYKVGFMGDGTVKAVKAELYGNGGHTSDYTPAVVERSTIHFDNCYRVPNMYVRGSACRTNTASNTAFRGFGGPQALFITESWISKVAEHLGVLPESIREKNMYKELGETTHYGQNLDPCTARRCWDECMEKSGFTERKQVVDEFNQQNRWRKRGISCVPIKFGIGFPAFRCQAGALVHIYTDGSVYLTHGGTEMGQGLHTKMIQIAGRCLGIPIDEIHISETSTNTVPNTIATVASISSDMNGMAVKAACDELIERLSPLRKEFPKLEWKDLIMKAFVKRISLSATGYYSIPNMDYTWDDENGKIKGRIGNYFTYGAAVSEVEVDCLTGDHVVLRTDIVMDVGRSLNPAIDIGQIEGGFVQGYGMFTLEEPLHTPSGHMLTIGPGAYKIPGFGNCPRQFNVHLLRNAENDKAIYSSKGIGEPPFSLSGSVLFAIKAAVGSARKDSGLIGPFRMDAPATAERIRMACGDNFSKQHRRHANEDEERKLSPWSITA